MLKDADLDYGNELVLLSVFHDSSLNRLFLKMYNIATEKLIIFEDQSGFLPFTYFKTNDPAFNIHKFESFLKENITKYESQLTDMTDLIEDKEIPVLKLYSSNTFNIKENLVSKVSNDPDLLIQQYENRIKIYESYVYDKQLIFSSNYQFKNKTLYGIDPILQDSQKYFLQTTQFKAHNDKMISMMFEDKKTSKSTEYQKYLNSFTKLLNQPIPDFKRVAIDIEIWNDSTKFPNVLNPVHPIISVSYVDNRENKWVVTSLEFIKKILVTEKKEIIENVRKELVLKNNYLLFVPTEKDLINHVFERMNRYPIVVTFNGDNFDLAYISERADLLGIDKKLNPIIFKQGKAREGSHLQKNPIYLKNSIHLDLFHLYKNISLQNYAFNARYKEYSLNAISKALLNKEKNNFNILIEFEKIDKMMNINKPIRYDDTVIDKVISSLSQLYSYNLHDSELTLELTTFSNNLTMNLITILSRITKTSIEDISRYGISNWARNMLYYEHRKRNAIIPTSRDLAKKGTVASVESIIKDKGFRGAFVLQTKSGVYFDVTCLDLGSMYPSIIKSFNLSYETVNCYHDSCQKSTVNKIDGTSHYICVQNHGMISLLIGVLRDIRLGYFKKMGKQNQDLNDSSKTAFYKTVDQAIKVFMNGTYGVLGSESFNMFCLPVAESVTAIGRHIITSIIDYATNKLNLNVILSDTDSIYVVDPSEQQIKSMIQFTYEKFNIDLELDKEYKFVILSERKKNYVGVTKKNIVDVKGLTGKKSNIPQYVKNCFNEILEQLKTIDNLSDLNYSMIKIKQIVKSYIHRLETKIDLNKNDLIFKIMINRNVDSYGKIKSIKKDVDGNEVITKVGIPSQIKIALEMNKNDPNLDISQNSVISFIKTKEGYKLPTQIKNLDEIDTKKYIETLQTALKPILETLDINFDNLILKSKQLSSLDEWLTIKKIQN